MTPTQHTIYSVSLFLALNALMLWCNRRNRRAAPEESRLVRKPRFQFMLGAKPILKW